MQYDPNTRRYVERRTAEGLRNKDIMRCLKRFVVREVYVTLMKDFSPLNTIDSP